MDTQQIQAIAQWYDTAPLHDPQADMAYASLAEECRYLATILRDRHRVRRVLTNRPDTYSSLRELTASIEDDKKIYTFNGGEPHPLWTRHDNTTFRFVHDYYGHYLGKCTFRSLDGELKAFASQAKRHNNISLPALAAEVVGQICWFYTHGRVYAPQKAVCMPEEYWRPLL